VNPPSSEYPNRILRMTKSLSITQSSRARWAALALALVSGFVALLLTSCKQGGADTKPPDVDYYTCTMHPSVKKQKPSDKCPICSMDLTPVMKKGASSGHDHGKMKGEMESGKSGMKGMPGMEGAKKDGDEQPTEFTVSVERQQQFGVTYATIEKRHLTHSMRAVGMVAYDKQRHWDYVARIDGYVT